MPTGYNPYSSTNIPVIAYSHLISFKKKKLVPSYHMLHAHTHSFWYRKREPRFLHITIQYMFVFWRLLQLSPHQHHHHHINTSDSFLFSFHAIPFVCCIAYYRRPPIHTKHTKYISKFIQGNHITIIIHKFWANMRKMFLITLRPMCATAKSE